MAARARSRSWRRRRPTLCTSRDCASRPGAARLRRQAARRLGRRRGGRRTVSAAPAPDNSCGGCVPRALRAAIARSCRCSHQPVRRWSAGSRAVAARVLGAGVLAGAARCWQFGDPGRCGVAASAAAAGRPPWLRRSCTQSTSPRSPARVSVGGDDWAGVTRAVARRSPVRPLPPPGRDGGRAGAGSAGRSEPG